jgi:hypothetical protein
VLAASQLKSARSVRTIQKVEQAKNVHECMLYHPDEFDVSAVRIMENVIRQLAHSIVRNRTQSTLQ